MTNREAHEEAAGMGLDDAFFLHNGIDPDMEYVENKLQSTGNSGETKCLA